MYKGEFVKEFAKKISKEFQVNSKIGEKVGSHVVNTILEKMQKSLTEGDGTEINCFGSMKLRKRNQTKRYNPIKKEMYSAEPSNVVFFKCSKVMREKIQ